MSHDLAAETSGPVVARLGVVEDRAEPVAPHRRRTDAADLVGVAALASLVCLGTEIAVDLQDYGLGRSDARASAVAALCVATVVGIVGVAVVGRLGPASLLRALTAVWRDPPGGWVAFVLGAIVAYPLHVLYAPILFGDADSARLLSYSRYFLDGHSAFGFFTDTQEPFLPPFVYAPAVMVNNVGVARLVALVTLQAAAGVAAFITFRTTRSLWGAATAALSLLCLSAIAERATRLPLYALMLSLGYLGGWFAYRAVAEPGARWRHAALAGVLLALSQEAHGVGQLFLAVPVLVAVFAPSLRSAAASLARMYTVVLVVMVPRIVVNLWIDGLDQVTSPRSDYWLTQGYLTQIQNKFMGYEGVSEPRGEYLSRMPGRFVDLLGPHGWIVVALAVLGAVIGLRGRARVFVPAALGFFVLAITAKQIPPFPRYYAPMWLGMAILVGVGVATLFRHRPTGTVGALAVTVVLAGAAFVTLGDAARRYEHSRLNIETNATRGIVETIDDGKGVIGSRSTQVFFSVTTEVPVWGGQFLTEEEYVTYLLWPSDAEVLDMLARHDIGWVYISEVAELELKYNNTWLVPAYGERARHVDMVESSPNFCRWRNVGFNIIYRVGPCPPGGPPVFETATDQGLS